jgi:hypothetical protein
MAGAVLWGPAQRLVMVILMLAAFPLMAAAAQDTDLAVHRDGLSDRITANLRVLSYGTGLVPAQSSQNPAYRFLDLPETQADLEVRLDLSLDLAPLVLSIQPRLRYQWDHHDRAGESDWDREGYVNQWLARVSLTPAIFLSYGRENLQWGPSYLISPSNPFFADNGRSNPKQEVAGMDFARLVWLPNSDWTVSLIANTAPGRQPIDPDLFTPIYALKLDWVGQTANGGAIISWQAEDQPRLGLYGTVTATDALLIYSEANIAHGSGAFYPVAGEGYFGTSLEPTLKDDNGLQGLALLGGAYTLEMGPTLSLEVVYNSSGYDDGQAERFYALRQRAAQAFAGGGALQAPAAGILARTADVGLRLLRQHYLMVQYSHPDIRDTLDLVLRWTCNLDDSGSQLTAIAELDLGDHLGLFLIGTANLGGAETEFGSFVDRQLMAGVQYTF